MKNRKVIMLLAAFLITSLGASSVLAKDEGKSEIKSNRAKVEIKIKNEVNTKDKNEDKEIEQKIEIKNNKFEIKGQITAVTPSNFVVAGQTIFLDPSQVNEFKQKGILEVGKEVKVEGIIKNEVKFAQEIKTIGGGQGRFKFEIKNAPNLSKTSLTLLPASPLPISSLTLSPSSSPSASVKVKLKAIGSVEQVKTFFQQILSFLQNLSI